MRVLKIFLVVSASFGVVLTVLPYSQIRPLLDLLSHDGTANRFTPALHHDLRIALVGITIMCFAAALGLQRVSPSVVRALSNDFQLLIRQRFSIPASHGVPLVCVTVFAAVLRLSLLDQPLRYDEATSFLYAGDLSLLHAVSNYYAPNNHVFHSVCMNVAITLFGDHPTIIRLPAFLAGIACVPLTYILCRTVRTCNFTPVFSCVAIAVLPSMLEWSTNGRGYSIQTALFLIAAIAASELAIRPRPSAWIVLVSAISFGAWTIPTMLYPAVSLFLFILIYRIGDIRRKASQPSKVFIEFMLASIALGSLTLILYSPILVVEGLDSLTGNRFVVTKDGYNRGISLRNNSSSLLLAWSAHLPRLFAYAVMITSAIGVPLKRSTSRSKDQRLFAMFLSCTLTALSLSTFQKLDIPPRTFAWMIPLVTIVLCSSITDVLQRISSCGIPTRWIQSLSLAFCVCAGIYLSVIINPVFDNEQSADSAEVSEFLRTRIERDDIVFVAVPQSAPVYYYFRKYGLPEDVLEFREQAEGAQRYAFVILNRERGYTVKSMLGAWNNRVDWSTLKCVAKFPNAEVHRLRILN